MTTMVVQSIVLVLVRFLDGVVGLGEGTSIGGLSYGSESPESIKAVIDTCIAPMLEDRDADNINHARTLIGKAERGKPIARSAVEIALWDVLGKRLGVPVAALLGVPVAALLGGAINTGMDVAWTLASGNSRRISLEPKSCWPVGATAGPSSRSASARSATTSPMWRGSAARRGARHHHRRREPGL